MTTYVETAFVRLTFNAIIYKQTIRFKNGEKMYVTFGEPPSAMKSFWKRDDFEVIRDKLINISHAPWMHGHTHVLLQ